MKRILLILIVLTFVIVTFAIITVFASEVKSEKDAMTEIEAALAEEYRISDGVISIPDDGYIGIPVELSVYFDTKNDVIPGVGIDATPIAVYVVNTNTERIGTDSDAEIIGDMLGRGYMVVVLDYLNSPLATSPDLDWSVQGIRASIKKGTYFANIEEIPSGSYPQNLTVPAGYTAEFNQIFWEIDKHCADGTLEYIVSVWNNDFRNYFAHRKTNGGAATIIKWVDENGVRKKTQLGYDGSSPVWYSDSDGTVVDENGSYIDVEYTLAEKVTDCVKADGSPLDLNLYMHLVYPKNPGYQVPVMCLASSSSHTANGTQTADRPQLNGYVFRGYAGVTFDYGYVPMERDDHYGFFDVGTAAIGRPTGDGTTYSVQFYNDKKINTAAMRFIRYLSLSNSETYQFDGGAIGVFGNSKGGWMVFLGEEHPELMAEERIFEGHSGETRYEAGLTETVGIIDGGEPQPWLEYGGVTIDSGADFIFSSCGTGGENITAAHAPTFITANLNDPTYYQTSNEIINACRVHNVPTVWFEVPVGHTLASGKDMIYGTDVHDALYKFSGYYLKGDALKVLYVHRETDYTYMPSNAPLTVKFSGAVAPSEIDKIEVKDDSGNAVSGEWTSAFGNTEWTFNSETLSDGVTYKLTVPAGIVGDNGTALAEPTVYSFNAGYELHSDSVSSVRGERGVYYYFTMPELGATRFSNGKAPDTLKLRVKVENEAANALSVYSLSGFDENSPDSATVCSELDTLYLLGKGYYDVDITEEVASAAVGDTIAILLSEARSAGKTTVLDVDFENGVNGITVATEYEITESPDGSLALTVDEFPIIEQYRETHPHYVAQNGTVFTTTRAIKSGAISAEDLGRHFTVSFRVYDTVSRYIQVGINGVTSSAGGVTDYDIPVKNIITKAGEWTYVELEYTVYDSLYENAPLKTKTLTLTAEHKGIGSSKLYIDDIKSVETVTEVDLANGAELLLSTSEQRSDPYMTEYGRIPIAFYEDVDKYPLLVFNRNGECVLGTDTLVNTSAGSALGYAQTQTDVDIVVLLRDNYEWNGEPTYNLSFIKGNVLIDLGGNTLTATTTVFNAQGKRSFPTEISVINGNILLENKPLIDVSGVNVSSYDYSTATKQFDFAFKSVNIGYIAGASGAPIVKNSWSSAPTSASVSFEDCRFELDTNAPASLTALFSLTTDSNNYIHTDIKVCGGTIVANDMRDTAIASVSGKDNSFEFTKNSDGDYTVLRIANGGSPTGEVFTTADGYCSFAAEAEGDTYTDYTLKKDTLATPYGLIPSEYASVSSYPVVYFSLEDDGSYTFRNAATSFFSSEYASRSRNAVMFVRDDCTVTGNLLNLGLHKNLTVDLNNCKVTFSVYAGIRPTRDSSNGNSDTIRLTFKNGEVIMAGTSSFLLFPNATASKTEGTATYLSFENVKFSKASGASATTPFVTHNNFTAGAEINISYTDCTFNIGNIDYSSSSLTLFKAGDNAGYVTETVSVSGGSIVTDNYSALTLVSSANSKSNVIFTKNGSGIYTHLEVNEASCVSVNKIGVTTDVGERIFGMTELSGGVGIFEPVFTEKDLTLEGYSVAIPPVYVKGELYPVIYITKSASGYVFAKASKTLLSSVSGQNDEVSLRSAEATVVILRCDYEFSNAANNLGFHGNVTFDLGGHILTCSSTHYLRPNSGSGGSNKLFTFKNGVVVLDKFALIEIGSHPSMGGTVSDIVFDGVSFVIAGGSTMRNPIVKYASTHADACKVNLTYKECSFDLTDISNSLTLFAAGSSNGYVSGTVTVKGGEILLTDTSHLTLTSVSGESSSVLFSEGRDGYTSLSVESGSAPTGYYNSDSGKRLRFIRGEDGTYRLGAVFAITGVGLKLTNDINVVWKVAVPEGCGEIYAEFRIGDGNAVTVTEYTVDSDGSYTFIFRNITPDKMGDIIIASIYADGELKASKENFSIKSYCEYILENYSYDEELIALVSDLLIYGEKAQLYVGYKTDALVTDGLGVSGSESSELQNKLSISKNEEDGISFEGIGLVLDSSLAFRLSFALANAEGMTLTVTIDGQTARYNVSELYESNGEYLFIYDGINATHFDETISIGFERNGVTLGTALTYSVNSYVYYIRSIDAGEKLADLADAIARYGASAKAYRQSHAE